MSTTTSKAADGRQRPTRDDLRFREVLGHFPTGVVVVTATASDGHPVGMTIGSFTSVSLDPPLVAFLPNRGSGSFARLRTAERFCINVLAADQEWVCRRFAGPVANRFSGVEYSLSPGRAPVIAESVAWIECSWHDVLDAGDHHFAIGRVHSLDVTRPVQPLLFFQGGYGRFAPLSLMALPAPDVIKGVRLAEVARPETERLAQELGVECSLMAQAGGELVIVAATAPTGRSPSTPIGSRVPLRPPLGDLYVAWQEEEVIQRWLDGAGPEPADQEPFRRRLARARERGWSMSLVTERPEGELHAALRAYSAADLTPDRQRRIEQQIRQLADAYEPVELVADRRFDVQSLVAPVRDADGEVALVLRLAQLPAGLTGAEVEALLHRLLESAERLGRTCHRDD